MKQLSPFTSSRFEYEERHVYYLPSEVFAELESPKPTFLIGTRGSGKTTLLKALTWRERIENQSLIRQLAEDPFHHRYIAVYIKAPEYKLGEMNKWLKECSSELHGNIVAYFLDLLSVELIAGGIADLIIRDVLVTTPEEEQLHVKRVIDEYRDLLSDYLPQRTSYTLRTLAKICKLASDRIQRLASVRAEITPLLDKLPATGIGEFGRRVCKMLSDLCNRPVSDKKWFFRKVCVQTG